MLLQKLLTRSLLSTVEQKLPNVSSGCAQLLLWDVSWWEMFMFEKPLQGLCFNKYVWKMDLSYRLLWMDLHNNTDIKTAPYCLLIFSFGLIYTVWSTHNTSNKLEGIPANREHYGKFFSNLWSNILPVMLAEHSFKAIWFLIMLSKH